jgi:hypothetical protein
MIWLSDSENRIAMLKIQRSSGAGVVFTLIGRIEIEDITELERLFSLEAGGGFVLDLEEVTLIDREAVKSLARWELENIELKNCPAYIRAWIDCEQKRESHES